MFINVYVKVYIYIYIYIYKSYLMRHRKFSRSHKRAREAAAHVNAARPEQRRELACAARVKVSPG